METFLKKNQTFKNSSIETEYSYSNDYCFNRTYFIKNKSTKTKIFLSNTQSTQTTNQMKTITNNFYKHKPKLNLKFINFHKNFLYEKIKLNHNILDYISSNNKNNLIQNVIYRTSNCTKRANPIRINLINYKAHSNKSSVNNSKSKLQNYLNNTYTNINLKGKEHKIIKENKSDFKYNCFTIYNYPKIRAENLYDFKNKVKNEIKGKFLISLKKNLSEQIEANIKDQIGECKEKLSFIKENGELFNNYLKIYDLYDKKLNYTLLRETEINRKNVQKMKDLENDIERLKYKIIKLIYVLKDHLQIKYYLMTVKNKTKLIEKFSKNDINELIFDKKLLTYYINNIEMRPNLNNMNNVVRKSTKQNYKRIFNRKNTLFNYLKKAPHYRDNLMNESYYNIEEKRLNHKNILMFKDENDFYEHLNSISERITFFLNNYNAINQSINFEKKELKKLIDQNNKKILEKEINDASIKLNIEIESDKKNKMMYENLIYENNNINYISNTLNMKIDSIFNNLYQFMKIDKTIDINDITMIEKIDLIEKLFNFLIKQKNEDKIKYPEEYNKLMKKIDREIKFEQIKLVLEEQKQQFNKKINKIIEKSNKIIIVPRKKVNENLFLKSKSTKKIKKSKNTLIEKDYNENFHY
jgi:hypothetical protein